ncbi:MAG: hypothetical protein AAGE84_15335 [Cyanobacteria bacterium P01_G01_bin.39]
MNTTASTEAEWATIAPDKLLIATKTKVWLESPWSSSDRFTQPMTGRGNAAITSKLLDGAMAAAKMAISAAEKPPKLTPHRLVWQLTGAYHISHSTPNLMEEAGQRFAQALRHDLSNWAYDKARKEIGHDRLALLDIESLGYQAEELVNSLIPPAAKILVDYFQRSVQDVDPIDCVGYVYALERMSLGAKPEHIQQIENLLPPEVNATRCLKEHSSLGSDGRHVAENVDIIARLSTSERDRVIRACYETALLLFSPPPEGYWLERQLETILGPFKLPKEVY